MKKERNDIWKNKFLLKTSHRTRVSSLVKILHLKICQKSKFYINTYGLLYIHGLTLKFSLYLPFPIPEDCKLFVFKN